MYTSPSRRKHPAVPCTPPSDSQTAESLLQSPSLHAPSRHHSFPPSPHPAYDSPPHSPYDNSFLIDDDLAMQLEQDNLSQLTHDITPHPTLPPTRSGESWRAVQPNSTKRRLIEPLIDLTEEEGRKRTRQEEVKAVKKVDKYERQLIYSRPPLHGESIAITNSAGDRVYLLISPPSLATITPPPRNTTLSLLPTSIAHLRALINSEQTSLAMSASLSSPLPPPLPSPSPSPSSHQLWVDKYRPRTFLDLLSPEDINRDVLSWIKQWDQCVFGQPRTSRSTQPNSHLTHRPSFLHSTPSTHSSTPTPHPLTTRPTPRLLLLSGPPGLGKTTLAHTLAHHAGYHTLEINASDDRSEGDLMEKVRGAVEMEEGVWMSKGGRGEGRGRPNCLVIDEIDGVMGDGGGAVAALIKLVMAEGGKPTDKESKDDADHDDSDDDTTPTPDDIKKKRSRRSKTTPLPPLRRPIIAICNDPYVPALRPLRAIAQHYHVGAPSRVALVGRLRQIARSEGLDVEDRALHRLVEVSGGDVRSAINALQWVGERMKGKRVTEAMVKEVGGGVKDVQRGRFDILDRVLGGKRKVKKDEVKDEVQSMFSACQEVEEGSKVMSMLHHNYLGLALPDPTLTWLTQLANEFSAMDGMREGGDDEEGSAAVVWPVVACQLRQAAMVALRRPPKPELDDTWKVYQEHERKKQLLQDWLRLPDNRLTLTSPSLSILTTQLLSPLLHILNPAIRPVALNLLSTIERRVVDQLIGTMVELGLGYEVRGVGGWGDGEVGLMPRVDGLVEFECSEEVVGWLKREEKWKKGAVAVKAKTGGGGGGGGMKGEGLTSKMKQLMIKEVEYEKIRRQERRREETGGPPPPKVEEDKVGWRVHRMKEERRKEEMRRRVEVKEVEVRLVVVKRKGTFLSEHSARLREKAAKEVKVKGVEERGGKEGKGQQQLGMFHFQYKEGFTQAVRRKVTISHFT